MHVSTTLCVTTSFDYLCFIKYHIRLSAILLLVVHRILFTSTCFNPDRFSLLFLPFIFTLFVYRFTTFSNLKGYSSLPLFARSYVSPGPPPVIMVVVYYAQSCRIKLGDFFEKSAKRVCLFRKLESD